MSSILEDVCDLLDSYNGRDKVVRLACYTCKLYGCLQNKKPWQVASSQLSNARMLLRLFDDIPMLRHTYNYGLGRNESSKSAAVMGVLANMIDQVFLPIEKICWFQEIGIIQLSDKTAYNMDTLSTVLWAGSLYLALLQNIHSTRQLLWSRECLQKSEDGGAIAKKNLDIRITLDMIVATKLCLDIVHAVSYLPEGWLWGGKIATSKIAGIATISSIISISMYFAKKRLLR